MTCDLCAEAAAAEWLAALDPDSDDPVLEVLSRACQDELDTGLAAQALVAGELVASAAGEAPDDLPPAAREWVERHGVPAEELIERALRAVRRVAIDDRLAAAHDDEWCAAVRDLRYRLGDLASPQ
jgi:Domain of unknown function (DUF4259)